MNTSVTESTDQKTSALLKKVYHMNKEEGEQTEQVQQIAVIVALIPWDLSEEGSLLKKEG